MMGPAGQLLHEGAVHLTPFPLRPVHGHDAAAHLPGDDHRVFQQGQVPLHITAAAGQGLQMPIAALAGNGIPRRQIAHILHGQTVMGQRPGQLALKGAADHQFHLSHLTNVNTARPHSSPSVRAKPDTSPDMPPSCRQAYHRAAP